MSFQITTAFVQQYKSNIFHLAQQKGSRLRGSCRNEMQVGKTAYFERLGLAAAVLKTSRHDDTPQIDSAHSRRAVTLNDYIWADLIDDEDRLRLLIDPTSAYSQAAMWSLGRSIDDVIIAAMRGSAMSGETGSTLVALPAAQKVLAANASAPGTPTNLNVDTLRQVKYLFDSNDIDESIPRYFAFSASQLKSLLAQTQVTSHDYASVKALVQGQIDTFLGFKFIRTQRVPLVAATYDTSSGAVDSGSGSLGASVARRCMAWCGDGVILSIGNDMEGRIDKRPDKNYSTQVFARMSVGAVRLEDVKVVEVVCNET